MKFTYNWLKDFVPVTLKPEVLAHKLTMAGLEVKGLEEKSGDVVFEVEITSNRPDWLSVAGIAREVAALTGKPFGVPKDLRMPARTVPRGKDAIRISVADKRDCPLYTAKIIRNVAVAPSPEWLATRLGHIGCRSINNVVDITNYILYTFGEPLHAFDLDTLRGGSISVRRAIDREKIITIDGIERTLDPDILVIADTTRAVALAGLMGGKETEVTGRTTAVLLEAAVFDPMRVRRGARICGFSSESSYRFERGVDPAAVYNSSSIAAAMIRQMAGGDCTAAVGTKWVPAKPRRVVVSISGIAAMLGVAIKVPEIKNALHHLGFSVAPAREGDLRITVPSWRPDVSLPVDIIEEVARIYGYEKIPATLAAVKPSVPRKSVRDDISSLKVMLTGLGFNEVITYSLVDSSAAEYGRAMFGRVPVELMNALTTEQGILRTSLVPGLVRCAGYNFNQKAGGIAVFELAKVFSQEEELDERYILGIAAGGERFDLLENGAVREELGFYHVKGAIESLCARLGLSDCSFSSSGAPGFTVVTVRGEKIGAVISVDKSFAARFDIKHQDIVAAEIDVEKLLCLAAQVQKKFQPLPRYPGILRDVSFIKAESLMFSDIGAALLKEGEPYLQNIRVIDYYRGKQVPPGSRSITMSLCYRSGERTLTDAEIEPLHARVCSVLKETFGLSLR